MYTPLVIPIDTAQLRPAPLVVPTWATYSELKRNIEQLNLSPVDYENAIKELCSALGM